MNRVIDNAALGLFASVMIFFVPNRTETVLAWLVGVIITAFAVYTEEKKQFAAAGIIFIVLCFFLPHLSLFVPVLVYHACRYRFVWMAAGILPFLLTMGEYRDWQIALWLLCCALAVWLSNRTERLEALELETIRVRDAGVELNLALREKNKNLMEKQDYEIYLATLRERNRIAREIHDNVGHMLSRSILQVGALATIHKEEPLNGQLTGINETLGAAMNSIRESVHDLHDDSIDLKQAVLDATDTLREKYTVEIDYDMTAGVPRKVKYCFITTVKEAVSNVIKHSNADRIAVTLREHPAFYQLCIEDNGTKLPAHSEGGIGLSNMRERVEALGGTIHIRTEKGFAIFISIKKEEV